MVQSMQIPVEWLREAGVENFKPTGSHFRCDAPHEMIVLADIEVPLRQSGYPLDCVFSSASAIIFRFPQFTSKEPMVCGGIACAAACIATMRR
jgi:hypothetical protein